LRAAARTLGAQVEALDVEGKDIAAIIRHASGAPRAKAGAEGGRWQEAGYWLLPLVALVLLSSFRREANEEVTA
jgi:Ca-activated chloride channel family protein